MDPDEAGDSREWLAAGSPPQPADPPGQRLWGCLSLIITAPIAGLVGAAVASLLFGDIRQGSIGALVGIGITYVVWNDVSKRIALSRAVRHYEALADRQPDNADACVQAGLWIHEKATASREEAEAEEFYREALRREPEHRDATVLLSASLLQGGRPQEALDLIEPWLVSREDPAGEAIAAQASEALGQPDRAASHRRRLSPHLSRVWETPAAQTQLSLLTWESPAHRIRIKYPADWTREEPPTGGVVVVFRAPREAASATLQESVNIAVEDLSAHAMSLDQYTELCVRDLKKGIAEADVLDSTPATLAGFPGHRLVFTGKGGGHRLEFLAAWTVKDDKAYVIAHTAEAGRCSPLVQAVEEMIESFEIT